MISDALYPISLKIRADLDIHTIIRIEDPRVFKPTSRLHNDRLKSRSERRNSTALSRAPIPL